MIVVLVVAIVACAAGCARLAEKGIGGLGKIALIVGVALGASSSSTSCNDPRRLIENLLVSPIRYSPVMAVRPFDSAPTPGARLRQHGQWSSDLQS